MKVDGVKNSTGFNSKGASVDLLILLKKHLPEKSIIASGGIHHKVSAIKLIQNGATRIATSSGVQLAK